MLARILIYGTIAGVIVGAMLSTTVLVWQGMPPAWGMALGYTTMLIALTAVFVGIKRHRDVELGGVIRFWPAFGMGVAMSVVAGIIYAIAWEIALTITQADFMATYAEAMIRQKREAGASAGELARYTAEMAELARQYKNPLYRFPQTFIEIFPVGLLVSLISAALLRNPRFMPARAPVATL